MTLSGISTVQELTSKIRTDKAFLSLLLGDLSITVTEMYRDPAFYRSLREEIIPLLKTYSFIKIWHAGCATGEEVYSMAILLKEEGIYDRSTIYATDFNQSALNRAKEGIIELGKLKEYTLNYQKSGGKETFSNYFTISNNLAMPVSNLKKNIVWANHNLVTDWVFSEVHLVICRNVLIYFNRNLQNKVLTLFDESLISGGILCLGAKESLRFTDIAPRYLEIDPKQRIFKKRYS